MHFKSGLVIELSPENFDIKNKKIIHPKLKNKKGMISYVASWCGHCRKFAPVYNNVSEVVGSSFPLFYLDCEKHGEFASKKLNVKGFPTILYIDRNGHPFKPYEKERNETELLKDICKESKVCKRT